MLDAPPPLSYARPDAADPRLRRWGLIALIVACGFALLDAAAIYITSDHFIEARRLSSPEVMHWARLVNRDATRLAQANRELAVAVLVLLGASALWWLRLGIQGVLLILHRSSLGPLRHWAWWRIGLSLLIPLPAMLMSNNLRAVWTDHAFAPPGIDPRLLIGGGATLLAWAAIVFPVIVLRRV